MLIKLGWVELANVDWSTGGSIDSGTITEKRFLLILTHCVAGGSTDISYTLNSDSGTTYSTRSSSNNATDVTTINVTSSGNQTYSGTGTLQSVCYIVNEADKDKLAVNCGQQVTVGGTAPNRIWSSWKWGNSSDAITSVQAISNFTTDSNLTVLGSD